MNTVRYTQKFADDDNPHPMGCVQAGIPENPSTHKYRIS